MSADMSAFDRVRLTRLAFGIRFQQQYGLEDLLGAVVDDILQSEAYSPERFENTLMNPDDNSKKLSSEAGDETLSLTRVDCIYEWKEVDSKKKTYGVDEVPRMAKDFIDIAWTALCERAPKTPSIIRYGCLVSFPAPEHWEPLKAMLDINPEEKSEFDVRYVRRVAVEGALVRDNINDFRNAIYMMRTRGRKTSLLMDFQRAVIADEEVGGHVVFTTRKPDAANAASMAARSRRGTTT